MRKTLITEATLTAIQAAISASGEYIGPAVDISGFPTANKIAFSASVRDPSASTAVAIKASLDFSNDGVHWMRDVSLVDISNSTRGRVTGFDYTEYSPNFIRARITSITGTANTIGAVDAKV